MDPHVAELPFAMAGQGQVASGVRTRISQEQLLGLMDDAYRNRSATLDWALEQRLSCG
nr:hypothetical protein JVH1_8795 [Rhodococcus sp. JVH1]